MRALCLKKKASKKGNFFLTYTNKHILQVITRHMEKRFEVEFLPEAVKFKYP